MNDFEIKKKTECSGTFINDRERSSWETVNVRSSKINILESIQILEKQLFCDLYAKIFFIFFKF